MPHESHATPIGATPGSGQASPGLVAEGNDETSRDTPLRVVVVEDEPFVRLDIELALETAGHQVVGTADSADGAVELAQTQRPDAMIMDVRLHGVRDGIDAAIEIWRRFGIRSVFASANLDKELRARAAAANPLGFVDKPFMSSTLVAALSAGI
jgi:DNA-binding NarL/FixJ family response regulator